MHLLKPSVTSSQDSWPGKYQETSHHYEPSGWETQEQKDTFQKDQLILGATTKMPIAHVQKSPCTQSTAPTGFSCSGDFSEADPKGSHQPLSSPAISHVCVDLLLNNWASSVLAENQVLHICIPTLRLLAHSAHPDGRPYSRLNDLLPLPPIRAQ